MEDSRSLKRRDFLKLMAASMGMVGLAACRPQPIDKVMPYSRAPEGLVAGEPLFFASAMEMDGSSLGLLVKSQMGRPIKIEGNPDHPASLGATNHFAQASILDLYDPDRVRAITLNGTPQRRATFDAALAAVVEEHQARQGAGLQLLTGPVGSPLLEAQIQALLEQYPQARWRQYHPLPRNSVYAGAQMAFGEPAQPVYRFDQAEVILSLDCDFMQREPGAVRYMHDFASRRRPMEGQFEMSRLYVVESSLSITGASADHRLALPADQIQTLAADLAARLDGGNNQSALQQVPGGWMDALIQDLQAHAGSSLVLVGSQQPPEVHALAHAMNQALGNVGQTIYFTPLPEEALQDPFQSLAELVSDLNAGRVEMIVILGGNPVFTAPADIDFAAALQQAGTVIYHGSHLDETGLLADWLIPAAHYLEMWSDTRAYDGTISLVQPLIEPLYDAWSPHELLSALMGQPQRTGYSLLREYWESESEEMGIQAQEFETFWRQALARGYIEDTAWQAEEFALQFDQAVNQVVQVKLQAQAEGGLLLVFEPDPALWDGRFANNAWLQELPRPLTKHVWDNPAIISPGTAQQYNLQNEDLVELHYKGRILRIPVFILPGQADGTVALHLGSGRTAGGNVLAETGVNTYTLRTSQAPWFERGLEIVPTAEKYPLAFTQPHFSMEDRPLVRHGTLAQFQQEPGFAQLVEDPPPSIYPEYGYDLHAWGMSINLSACTGCNACVVACQAENNVPVVGKDEVLNHREMHWLRIDRYIEGQAGAPQVFFQPLLCMHCEKAPCEPVCPVNATVHSSEGLNEMVYARCIGVRYCSHNCPYKVRRFNHFQYADEDTLPLIMARNPEVTVRKRGVIEKCTFCVQRINYARSKAKMEGRRIQDTELMTACQQACPTRAIVFGDLNNPESQVLALKQQPHDYGLLAELGTQPRVTYLAEIRNNNPDLDEADDRRTG
jgi:Fe-S-cluster-containing dehydrogenase component/anaerobic selenocysteine-containing dehydrogenase